MTKIVYVDGKKIVSSLHLHSGKKLALIILVQCLHSIITYFECYSSLTHVDVFPVYNVSLLRND